MRIRNSFAICSWRLCGCVDACIVVPVIAVIIIVVVIRTIIMTVLDRVRKIIGMLRIITVMVVSIKSSWLPLCGALLDIPSLRAIRGKYSFH